MIQRMHEIAHSDIRGSSEAMRTVLSHDWNSQPFAIDLYGAQKCDGLSELCPQIYRAAFTA